ncbi:MAG: hypothetical protein ABI477_17585, partial [Chryseolinea sp.]
MHKLLLCAFIVFVQLNLASQGAFSMVQQDKPEIIKVTPNIDSVGLYDKYEARLTVKSSFVNPFDPDEIDIQAVFTS